MAKKKDVLLEHEYDGIQELDNELPGWWLGLFYISIAISVLYLFYYHFIGIGPTQAEEYEMAINPDYQSQRPSIASKLLYHSPYFAEADLTPRQRAQLALQGGADEAFMKTVSTFLEDYDQDEGTQYTSIFNNYIGANIDADGLIMEAMRRADEKRRGQLQKIFPDLWARASSGGGAMPAVELASSSNVAEVADIPALAPLTAESDLNSGKEIFTKNCVTCHMAGGAGGIGPNLTDDFWLHGAGINNLVKIINSGVPAKGMITWRGVLKEKEIHQVASYILKLHGTNPPNPKAAQGEKVDYPLN